MLCSAFRFCFALVSGLLILACGQNAHHPTLLDSPTSPTAVGTGDAIAIAAQEVPFHSELVWQPDNVVRGFHLRDPTF